MQMEIESNKPHGASNDRSASDNESMSKGSELSPMALIEQICDDEEKAAGGDEAGDAGDSLGVPESKPQVPGSSSTIEVRMVRIADLVLDPAVHVRAKTDQKRVEQYSIAYVAGDPLPAVDVFFDGTAYYVANGYHRVPARKKAGFDEILCNIRKGGKREAILFALGQDRNLPRSNADKVKAATQLLNDPEWRAWSDAVIGRLCDVTPQFIGKLGKKLGVRKTIRKTKAGRTINVSKMGAKGKHPADPAKKPDAKPQPGATRNGFGSVGNSGTGSLATPTDLERRRRMWRTSTRSEVSRHSRSSRIPARRWRPEVTRWRRPTGALVSN
jgi:uncharacterized ParB-like nuclease family protein